MTDDNQGTNLPEDDEMSFEALMESYDMNISSGLKQGDKVSGQIISIGKNQIYVDTGTKSDGVVAKTELLDEEGNLPYQVGDKVQLYVVSSSESEVILSKAITGSGQSAMLKDAAGSKTPVEGRVTGSIKGGFQVEIMGKRAFCPISQMDVKYVENEEGYIDQTFRFLITRFESGGKNIVVSRRELLNREIQESREQFLETIKAGDTVSGTVSKLMPFGAFVELSPGVEGMVHISQLSWSRIEKPEEAVRTGDQVNVKILKIEPGKTKESPKISLSIRETSADPWETAGSRYKQGDQVAGKVVRLADFGAFVEIEPGVDGLVHISEMSHTRRVIRPQDEVETGQMVQVSIKSIDMENRRISLSIKDAKGDPWTGISQRFQIGKTVEGRFEKKETFGLFISLEPGVVGLMPSSQVKSAADPGVWERLKPSDTVKVVVQAVDEEARRITLAPPDQTGSDEWQSFSESKSGSSFGSMGELLQKALDKKKK